MDENKIVNIIIENAWYKEIVNFIQKAYNISDEELGRYINGCRPVVTEADKANILKQLKEETKKQEEKPVEKKEEKNESK